MRKLRTVIVVYRPMRVRRRKRRIMGKPAHLPIILLFLLLTLYGQ
jgi:hypothetical protein